MWEQVHRLNELHVNNLDVLLKVRKSTYRQTSNLIDIPDNIVAHIHTYSLYIFHVPNYHNSIQTIINESPMNQLEL